MNHIREMLEKMLSYAGRTAFRYYENDKIHRIAYDRYVLDILSVAQNIETVLERSVGKKVAIISENRYECYVILYAVFLSGNVAVPMNYLNNLDSINKDIASVGADIVFVSDNFEKTDGIIDSNVKKFDISEFLLNSKKRFLPQVCEKELPLVGNELISDSSSNNQILILFTSGTNGIKKGVCLSETNLFANKRILLPGGVSDKSTPMNISAFLTMPVYHIAGIVSWVCWSFFGCSININRFPGEMYDDLEKMPSDYAVVSPATIKMWGKSLKRGKTAKLGGLKELCSVGAPLDSNLCDLFMENGIQITQAYGMTETSSKGTMNIDMTKPDSVGKPADSAEIRISNSGEVLIKSDGNMLGYHNMPKETESTLENEWIHTGDLGYIDCDGYLFLTGRLKNIIILSGGENVSPEEIESVLYKNPLIEECKVFESDDKICAEIFCREQDVDVINEFVKMTNESFPIYMKIRKTVFRKAPFLKSSTGKIIRV